MIYFSKVFAFTLTIELNILTWTFWSTFFLKSGYLRATMFDLTKWPFIWSGIFVVIIDGSWYPFLGFSASILLYLPTIIEFIGGQSIIMFTWVVIIGPVNTIWSVPTTLVCVTSSPILLFKFLLVETLPYPQPKFVANWINIPPLTTFVLGATIISIPVVVMTTLGDWVTSIPTSCFRISTITTSNTLS